MDNMILLTASGVLGTNINILNTALKASKTKHGTLHVLDREGEEGGERRRRRENK